MVFCKTRLPVLGAALCLSLVTSCAQHTVSHRYKNPTPQASRVNPETGLPYKAETYLTTEPFKMPSGFPRTPDAFGDRKTLKGSDVHFYSRMSLDQIKNFYRTRMTKYGLVEVNPNSGVIDQCMIIEFSGWPTRERIEVMACDEAYTSTNDRRWVSARFRWKEE